MEKICKNCKFWEKESPNPPNYKPRTYWGFCQHTFIGIILGLVKQRPEPDEDFGCILFEEKNGTIPRE